MLAAEVMRFGSDRFFVLLDPFTLHLRYAFSIFLSVVLSGSNSHLGVTAIHFTYWGVKSGTPQKVAKHLKNIGSLAVVYDSVRHQGGECAAVFKPRILSNFRDAKILVYQWNGKKITGHYEKSNASKVE
jgi:hypothetical protein